ncbi:MAG: type 1 glutamine amidotransferase [Chromatocurvus sp.]
MAARPRVGVTGAARRWAPAWWCTRLALWLAGASAVRVSVRHGSGETDFDALVIGGGNDIGPEHYQGDIREPVKTDKARDALEIRWIQYALENNKPLLGICRGAQLINVVLGGNLHQDIRKMRQKTHNRPGLLPTKTVTLLPHSQIALTCESQRLRVNRLHHQALRESGKGLKVVGRDLDNLVQAVESSSGRQILGVQWHPEYLFYLPAQRALFRWLVSQKKAL